MKGYKREGFEKRKGSWEGIEGKKKWESYVTISIEIFFLKSTINIKQQKKKKASSQAVEMCGMPVEELANEMKVFARKTGPESLLRFLP